MQSIQEKMKLTILSFLLFLFLSHIPQPATSVPRRWHTLKHTQVNAAANTESPSSIAVPPASEEGSSVNHFFPKSFLDWFKGGIKSNQAHAPAFGADAALVPQNPALVEICKATSHPELCFKSISPLVSPHVDVMAVLQAAINACQEQIKMAMAIANNLRDSQQVGVCRDQYKDALDNIQGALDAIKAKDIGTLKTLLGAIIADANSCEDNFDGQDSPLADVDEVMSDLASNCLAIAVLLKWGPH